MARTKQSNKSPDSIQEKRVPSLKFGHRKEQSILWSLRALIKTEAVRRITQLASDDDVERTLDITEQIHTAEMSPMLLSKFYKDKLSERLAKLETTAIDRSDLMFANIDRLGKLIGLTDAEREILAFYVECENDRGLSEIAEQLPRITSARFPGDLASVIGKPHSQVRTALKPSGLLQKIRLIQPTRYRVGIGYEINDDVSEALLQDHLDDSSLLRVFFSLSPKATLAREDFPHLQDTLSLAIQLVGNGLKKNKKGTNLLIHGPPGTGKTEFARLIANELSVKLYEVGVMDSEGEFQRSDRRMAGYMSCQHFLRNNRKGIVLFDEIEDVFPSDYGFGGGFGRNRELGKGAVNKVLEENPAPSIWISNDINQMDPAYLRRFDYIVQIDHPPLHVRTHIWKKHLERFKVSDAWIARAAQNQRISPADIERAASVAKMALSPKASVNDTEKILHKVLDANLQSRGLRFEVSGYHHDESSYDLSFLNADSDLKETSKVLTKTERGAMLLHGPPGCGKTAYVYHLGHTLGKTVVHKKASDLLSMWVGGTERAIAQMFQSVDPKREILLLDEADSFLQDRSGAQRSWEITQVNEMLVQMESFQGLFICATNFMKSLDQASFRRFDLKVGFKFMTPQQSWKMFRHFITRHLGRIAPKHVKDLKMRLSTINVLTPGDFATIERKSRLTGETYTPDGLIKALEQEGAVKRENKNRSIGFG